MMMTTYALQRLKRPSTLVSVCFQNQVFCIRTKQGILAKSSERSASGGFYSHKRNQINHWRQQTQHLIELNNWEDTHKRKAERCLQFWSQNKALRRNELQEFWRKIQQQSDFHETTPAQFDYAVLSFAKHDMATESLDILQSFISKDFDFKSQNNRHIPHSYHLNAVLHSFARQGEPEKAEGLLMKCFKNPENYIAPSVYSVTSVIDAWSRTGNSKRALELLEFVESIPSFKLNTAAYNAVLTAFARSNSPNAYIDAQKLVRRMPVSADASSWSSLLIATASHSPELAQESLLRLYEEGEKINTVCLNVVLNAWGKRKRVDKAETLLRRWLQLIEREDVPRELWPTLMSFNIVLGSLAKSRNGGSRAQSLLEEMESIGIEADTFSLNSVLNAWSNQGNPNRAMKFLDQLLSMESDPDQRRIAFNTTIVAWANSCRKAQPSGTESLRGYDLAKTVLGRMVSEGVSPDVVTYNSLLKVLASIGSFEAAEEASALLHSMTFQPDIISYATVIDAWARSGDSRGPDRAFKLLTSMEEMGVKPNVVSLNSVIHTFSKLSHPRAAEQAQAILDEMKSSDRFPKPDLLSYCSLLSCWANSYHFHKARRARSVLDEMVKVFNQETRSKQDLVLLRNAHNIVVKACAYTRREAGGEVRTEALDIAISTFRRTPDRCDVSYVTYFKTLHHLVSDAGLRNSLIETAFNEYRSTETQFHDSVLTGLRKVTSPETFERLTK